VIGRTEYNRGPERTRSLVQSLNDLPVKVTNGGTTYIRDVAHLRSGYQTNIALQDGQRGVLLTVQKPGRASTLSIVSDSYKAIPKIAATLPSQLVIKPRFVFVRASSAMAHDLEPLPKSPQGKKQRMWLIDQRGVRLVLCGVPLARALHGCGARSVNLRQLRALPAATTRPSSKSVTGRKRRPESAWSPDRHRYRCRNGWDLIYFPFLFLAALFFAAAFAKFCLTLSFTIRSIKVYGIG